MSAVCQINRVGRITWTKHAHAQSQVLGCFKTELWHPRYSFRLYARAALAWTKKKCSLRNEKLKANRASETEEQIKERLRIRSKNEKIENHEKQRLATLKRLKRGDDNELERNLRDWRRWSLANSSGWPWRQKKKEEQDSRMMQLF